MIKELEVAGSRSHGTGFRFSLWLPSLSMITRFVEALLEFSRKICKVYSSWFHFTLRQIEIVSNEGTNEYRV